ncbi:MAG: hypothetical protein QXI09_00780 [Candidatus Aenigmatarchaeota archaeon]
MKGDVSFTMVLVFAVIVIAILLVIFLTRGVNPLELMSTKSNCEAKIRNMCNTPGYDPSSIPRTCAPYFKEYGKDSDVLACIDSGDRESTQCRDFCDWFVTIYLLGQG